MGLRHSENSRQSLLSIVLLLLSSLLLVCVNAAAPVSSLDSRTASWDDDNSTSYIPLHQLGRRADLSWETAVEKGKALMCKLEADTATASRWTDYAAIGANGWSLTSQDEPGFDGMDAVFKDLLGADSLEENEYKQVKHDTVVKKTVDGEEKEFPATGGNYGNLFNAEFGMIAADENYSPATMRKDLPSALLPDLRQWSDMLFLLWQQVCTDADASAGSLEHIFRVSVSGPNSLSIIEQAVKGTDGGSMEQKWSQRATTTFKAGTDAFYAILATDNGKSLPWFLLQHRAQMGKLTIKSVSYFYRSSQPCLYFNIGQSSPEAE